MKKKLLLSTCIAGIIALATACSSQSTTTATTAASTTAETMTEAAVKENTTAAEKETTAAEKTESTTAAKDKTEADSKADETSSEKSDETKESEMTGTIGEIKDFMFTLTADGKDYAFTYEASNKPEGLSEVKDGDKVTVTYTGTVDEVDAFDGTIISVTKAN